MAKLGRYRKLPLPPEWLDVLEGLQPFEAVLQRPLLPITLETIEKDLNFLDVREADVILQRFAKQNTLDEVGKQYEVTRERVRQIEKTALTRLRGYGKVRVAMTQLIEQCKQGANGFVIDSLASKELNLTAEEVWLFLFRLYKKISNANYETQQSKHGYWLVYPKLKRGKQPKLDVKIFMDLDEAANCLETTAYQLIHCYEIYDSLWLTHSTKLGNTKWSKMQCLEALATELAEAGYTEWHFSEMARALEFVFPEKFRKELGRNTAALIGRSEMFQFTGRKGYWQLASFSDGFASTKEALITLLDTQDIPIHVAHLYEKLERNVTESTVLAILGREKEFTNHSKGVFSLKDKNYSYTQQDLNEALWLFHYLCKENINTITLQEADTLAIQQGIQPWRLRTAVVLSQNLIYVRAGGTSKGEYYPATYQRACSYYQRQFNNWYKYQRSDKGIPDEVLSYMLNRHILQSSNDIKPENISNIQQKFMILHEQETLALS